VLAAPCAQIHAGARICIFRVPLGTSSVSFEPVAPYVFKNHTELVHLRGKRYAHHIRLAIKLIGLLCMLLLMCSPTQKLLKWDCRLRKAGWDPHSVEGLGMVDSETLSNLTRAFGEESLELVRNLESVRTRSQLVRNLELVRPRSNDGCESEGAVNKKGARRYVVPCQTGIIILIISTCVHSPALTFAA
jgi:hypothetical protein